MANIVDQKFKLLEGSGGISCFLYLLIGQMEKAAEMDKEKGGDGGKRLFHLTLGDSGPLFWRLVGAVLENILTVLRKKSCGIGGSAKLELNLVVMEILGQQPTAKREGAGEEIKGLFCGGQEGGYGGGGKRW